MLSRTKAIIKKEFKQLGRDKRMLFVIFFFPVFLLWMFGYAINFDVKKIKLAVYNQNHSETSRDFVNSLTSSDYFEVVNYIENEKSIKPLLDQNEAQVILVVPPNFEEALISSNKQLKIQFIIDGVDGNTASIIRNYLVAATSSYNQNYQQNLLTKAHIIIAPPVDFRPVFWFNPELQTTKFLLPGLIALILIVTAVVSVSLSLVREVERGTMEQINISSLNPFELLIGKAFPYLVIAFINSIFILIAGYLLFDFEIMGSYWLLFISIIIFLAACTAVGILISVIADSQQVAFTLATFFSLLPSLILSGFIFPIESMPYLLQLITNITPTKYFIIILRAILLRGVGLSVFWDQWLYLLFFTIIMLLLATIISKRKEAAG